MLQKEKILNFIIVVIAVVGGFYFTFYFKNNIKSNSSSTPIPTPYLGAKLEDVSVDALDSSDFPAIPVPGGVLIKSLKATSPEGKIQLTKIYSNADSAEVNYQYFRSLLIKEGNGWTVISKVDDPTNPGHKALFATDANGILNINISKPDDTGSGSIIDLSYVLN